MYKVFVALAGLWGSPETPGVHADCVFKGFLSVCRILGGAAGTPDVHLVCTCKGFPSVCRAQRGPTVEVSTSARLSNSKCLRKPNL